MSDIKFLANGEAVVVVGEGPPQQTSNDGGRTLTEVPHTEVARLTTELVDTDQLFDKRPEAAAPADPTQPPAPLPQEGDALNADQLQAKIDALVVQKEAAEAAEAAGDEHGASSVGQSPTQ